MSNLIYFSLGFFIGSGIFIWFEPFKKKGEIVKQSIPPVMRTGKTTFVEPVNLKKKWLESESLKDFLK